MAEQDEPAEIALVRAFLNTVDLESGTDLLADPAAAGQWLVGAGLLPAGEEISRAEWERLRGVREVLRAAVSVEPVPGRGEAGPSPAEPAGPLTEVALRVGLVAGEPVLWPAGGGAEGALATIVAAAVTASARGSWARLKLCSRDTCQWAYYDRSKNRSGRWCSMAVCGNRHKTRAYRARRASPAQGT